MIGSVFGAFTFPQSKDTKMQFESLDKMGEIVRFPAKSEADAMTIVKTLHYKSLIKINRNFVMLKTVLQYKQQGY